MRPISAGRTWYARITSLYDAVATQRPTAFIADQQEPHTTAAAIAIRLTIDGGTMLALVAAAWYNSQGFLLAACLARIIAQHAAYSLYVVLDSLVPALDLLTRATKDALFAWREDDDGALASQWDELQKLMAERPDEMMWPLESHWSIHGINVARLRYHGYDAHHSKGAASGRGRFYKMDVPCGASWVNAVQMLMTMITHALRHDVVAALLCLCFAVPATIFFVWIPDVVTHTHLLLSAFCLGLLASAMIVLFWDTAQSFCVVLGRVLDCLPGATTEKKLQHDDKKDTNALLCAVTQQAETLIRANKGKRHIELPVDITPLIGAQPEFGQRMTELGYACAASHCVGNGMCLFMCAH